MWSHVLPIVLTLNIVFLTVSEAFCILKPFSPAHPPVHLITGYNVYFLQGFDCVEISRLLMLCKQHLGRGAKETSSQNTVPQKAGRKEMKEYVERHVRLWLWRRSSDPTQAESRDVPFQSDLDPAQKGTQSLPVAAPCFSGGKQRKPSQYGGTRLELKHWISSPDFNVDLFHYKLWFLFSIQFHLFIYSFKQWTLSDLDITMLVFQHVRETTCLIFTVAIMSLC